MIKTVIDEKGKPVSVIIPIEEWNEIQELINTFTEEEKKIIREPLKEESGVPLKKIYRNV